MGLFAKTRLLHFTAILVAAAVMPPSQSAAAPHADWLTGRDLEEQLAGSAGVFWSGRPLRDGLASLSAAERVAVLLDRRVDPGTEMELTLQNRPLGEVFGGIAASLGLGATRLGPVVYIGPPEYTTRLRTLVELRRDDVRKLPSAAARRWTAQRAFAWEDFATPRGLVDELGSRSGLRVEALEQIPHDLWAGADLPPLDLVERLTLVVGQFDLSFTIAADGRSVALVPIPERVAVVRSYPGGPRAEQVAAEWKRRVPGAEFAVRGETIWVRGLVEEHEQLRGPSEPREHPSTPPAEGRQVYTLTFEEKPVGPVLRQLAAHVKLTLEVDEAAIAAAGISLDKRISVSVKDVSAEQLFRQVAAAAGLDARIVGETVRVRPKQ